MDRIFPFYESREIKSGSYSDSSVLPSGKILVEPDYIHGRACTKFFMNSSSYSFRIWPAENPYEPISLNCLIPTNTICSGPRSIMSSSYGGGNNILVTRRSLQDDQVVRIYLYNDGGGGGQENWLRIGQLPPEELCIDIPESITNNFEGENSDRRMGFCVNGPAAPADILSEVLLGITGQTAISLLGYGLNGGTYFPPALYGVVAANAVGFVGTLAAMLLREKKPEVAGILAKVGAMGAASATIVAIGMFLPFNFLWTGGVASAVSAVAVALV